MQIEIRCVKKQMKAERWAHEERGPARATAWARHTSRHTSPEDGDACDSRKVDSVVIRKAPCLHPKTPCASERMEFFANRYFDCQKTKGAGFKPPREAARSFNSFRFSLSVLGAGVRSRELLPDLTAIYGRRLSESDAIRIDAPFDGRQAQTDP